MSWNGNRLTVQKAPTPEHAFAMLQRAAECRHVKYSIPERLDCESLQRWIHTGLEPCRCSSGLVRYCYGCFRLWLTPLCKVTGSNSAPNGTNVGGAGNRLLAEIRGLGTNECIEEEFL